MSVEFVDANVMVYAFTTDPRTDRALAILEGRPVISVQCLNEFANVARRKLTMDWPDVRRSLQAIRRLCSNVMPIDLDVHEDALRIAERYGYRMFDCLIIASALQADSERLWSEDMQDGLVIDGRLSIANPFRTEG